MRELQNHEDSLLEEGRQMNIRFDTHKSEKSEKSETAPMGFKEPPPVIPHEVERSQPEPIVPTRDSAPLSYDEVRISQEEIG